MDDTKNGGANNLRAWRMHRKMTVEQLATAVGTSAGQLSDLENDNRGLTAKWLRRLSGPLKTTPGHLLDHDPSVLPTDIVEIWLNADPDTQRRLVDVARALVKSSAVG
jgi:transcriptional regulator with XRE-family HTH domain